MWKLQLRYWRYFLLAYRPNIIIYKSMEALIRLGWKLHWQIFLSPDLPPLLSSFLAPKRRILRPKKHNQRQKSMDYAEIFLLRDIKALLRRVTVTIWSGICSGWKYHEEGRSNTMKLGLHFSGPDILLTVLISEIRFSKEYFCHW